MKDFNNTYIKLKDADRTVERIKVIADKYSRASKCKLEDYFFHERFYAHWLYLTIDDSNEVTVLNSKNRMLGRKEITEEDLDNYLKEQDGVTEYERVTGMTISQVVNAMTNGDELYVKVSSERYSHVTRNVTLELLNTYVTKGSLYRKVEEAEALWWDKHKGTLVAVRYNMCGGWQYDVFKEYNKVSAHHPFQCKYNSWKEMRPLTKVEKDAIITKD